VLRRVKKLIDKGIEKILSGRIRIIGGSKSEIVGDAF